MSTLKVEAKARLDQLLGRGLGRTTQSQAEPLAINLMGGIVSQPQS
jgi:hypothetical protein